MNQRGRKRCFSFLQEEETYQSEGEQEDQEIDDPVEMIADEIPNVEKGDQDR